MGSAEQGHYPYQAPIDAYGNGGFRFAEMSHRGSLLCLPTGMHAWDQVSANGLNIKSLQPILDLSDEIDVLFVGMGEELSIIPPDLRSVLKEHAIVVEGLSTGSAISIYNILLSEKRAVAAALIAVERPSRVDR
jgi:uncharacterized protein